jgi:hypothetical protein
VATAVKLKYLFSVIYDDGTQFIQNEEDVSAKDPKKSAFSDVDVDKVFMFTLTSPENSISLNLIDGKFYPGGFTVGEMGPWPHKLIFYRQHTHNFNVDLEELSHIIKYCIGYTDAEGVEHKIYVE